MGIKDLNSFLKLNTPSAINEIDLICYRGKTVCIDTSIFLYKYLYKNERFLEGFFQQIYRLVSNGVKPIYVFDGIPPKQKFKVISNRREKKKTLYDKSQKLQLEYEIHIDSDPDRAAKIREEIKKNEKRLITITSHHIDNLKFMLDLMNIQYIQAPGEADLYCSMLYKQGKVDLCLSDDMDLLVSGSTILLRDFNVSSNIVLEYNLNKILAHLNLTKEQWVDFCILCGCDYSPKIYGIGTKNAYKYILEYKNIETILDNVKDDPKISIPNNFNYIIARKIFKGELLTNNINKNSLNVNDLQCGKITNFIKENSHLSYQQISTRIRKIYSC